jgi:hypothetical protein
VIEGVEWMTKMLRFSDTSLPNISSSRRRIAVNREPTTGKAMLNQLEAISLEFKWVKLMIHDMTIRLKLPVLRSFPDIFKHSN